MKQIVPFKKDLEFKTKVSEITSISLEKEINVEEEGVVTGIFHITGDYKMNEGSINRDNFSFDLPFDITLDPRYDINTVKVDIDDFYYDVINNDTLKVNIDLFIEADYLPEEIKENNSNLDDSDEDDKEIRSDDILNDIKIENVIDDDKVEIKDNSKDVKIEKDRDNDGITAYGNKKG